jgi:circadian clock protein KaiC
MATKKEVQRVETGIRNLDALLCGGLPKDSVTVVSGSAGIGKTTMGLHFIAAGIAKGEPGLYLSIEEAPAQVSNSATSLGLWLKEAVDQGCAEILYLPPGITRSSQFLSILAEKVSAQKTRGSAHDRGTYYYTIDLQGMHFGERVTFEPDMPRQPTGPIGGEP